MAKKKKKKKTGEKKHLRKETEVKYVSIILITRHLTVLSYHRGGLHPDNNPKVMDLLFSGKCFLAKKYIANGASRPNDVARSSGLNCTYLNPYIK